MLGEEPRPIRCCFCRGEASDTWASVLLIGYVGVPLEPPTWDASYSIDVRCAERGKRIAGLSVTQKGVVAVLDCVAEPRPDGHIGRKSTYDRSAKAYGDDKCTAS